MNNRLGVFNSVEKVIAVGDLHGDYSVLLHILIELTQVAITDSSNLNDCNAMDLSWNPDITDTWLVFCGDLIDMKRNPLTVINEDCDFQILDTLFKLQEEAEKFNSKIIILVGNHEIMNFQKNYDYVPIYARSESRSEQFKLGSDFAKKIASRTFLSVRIGDLIFVHGGFCSKFIKVMMETNGFNGLIDINTEIIPQLNYLLREYLTNNNKKYTEKLEKYIFGGETSNIGSKYGPLWCREQSLLQKCVLNEIAQNLNIPGYSPEEIIFIVAHTPQLNNGINSICDGRLWRIDIGMSRAFDENPESIVNFELSNLRDQSRSMGVLQITDNGFQVITNNVLSRTYRELLRDDKINFLKKYTEYFSNNKKKLKEVVPAIKKLL
jgi:hypothetical protein